MAQSRLGSLLERGFPYLKDFKLESGGENRGCTSPVEEWVKGCPGKCNALRSVLNALEGEYRSSHSVLNSDRSVHKLYVHESAEVNQDKMNKMKKLGPDDYIKLENAFNELGVPYLKVFHKGVAGLMAAHDELSWVLIPARETAYNLTPLFGEVSISNDVLEGLKGVDGIKEISFRLEAGACIDTVENRLKEILDPRLVRIDESDDEATVRISSRNRS